MFVEETTKTTENGPVIVQHEEEATAKMTSNYNVAVVGKVGVGKSALINYLFGKQIREVGIGKGVTEKGFHREDTKIKKVPVSIFDSWGLELSNSSEWLKILKDELSSRRATMSPDRWFHTVIYCISAATSRYDAFEIRMIQQFIKEKYKVIVALTKADLVSEDEIRAFQLTLDSTMDGQFPPTIPVCSEEKLLRHGKTERFGAEELKEQIYNDFLDTITTRLPYRCIERINQHILDWKKAQEEYIDKHTKNYNLGRVNKYIADQCDSFVRNLTKADGDVARIIMQETRETIELYESFSEALNDFAPVTGKKFFKSEGTPFPEYNGFTEFVVSVLFGVATLGTFLVKRKKYNISELKRHLTKLTDGLMEEVEAMHGDVEAAIHKLLEPVLSN